MHQNFTANWKFKKPSKIQSIIKRFIIALGYAQWYDVPWILKMFKKKK